MRQSLRSFDRKFTKLITALPVWLRPLFIAVSLLGEPVVTLGLSAVVVGIGIGQSWDILTVAGATAIITIAIASLLKLLLRRKRPINDYTNSFIFDTFSFPSGHAAGSLVSYGLLAILGVISTQSIYSLTVPIILVIVFLIGISRVYLGAHYPSDVIGGWIIGSLGLLFIVLELLA